MSPTSLTSFSFITLIIYGKTATYKFPLYLILTGRLLLLFLKNLNVLEYTTHILSVWVRDQSLQPRGGESKIIVLCILICTFYTKHSGIHVQVLE